MQNPLESPVESLIPNLSYIEGNPLESPVESLIPNFPPVKPEPLPPLRRPRSPYYKQNGFIEPLEEPRLESDTGPDTLLSEAEERAIYTPAALEKRRLADFVLAEAGTGYFPSFEEMEAELAANESPKYIRREIEQLQESHSVLMDKLYAIQSEEHFAERHIDKIAEHDFSPSDFTTAYQSHLSTQLAMSSISQLNYGYLSQLLPLQQSLSDKEAEFPKTIDDWRAIRSTEIKRRVAAFLNDEKAREGMMDKFGWAWRTVNGLISEFEENAAFKTEVQELMKEPEVRDPRRRASRFS